MLWLSKTLTAILSLTRTRVNFDLQCPRATSNAQLGSHGGMIKDEIVVSIVLDHSAMATVMTDEGDQKPIELV